MFGHGKAVFQFGYDILNFCGERRKAPGCEPLSGGRTQWRLDCSIEDQLFRARPREFVAEITEASFIEQIHAVMAIIPLTESRLNRNPRSISRLDKLCERYEYPHWTSYKGFLAARGSFVAAINRSDLRSVCVGEIRVANPYKTGRLVVT